MTRALAAIVVLALSGCAPATAGLGSSPYRVGPITVTIADADTVDRECRFLAPSTAVNVGPILGCYLPGETPRIYATPDPYVLLHEFKHHFDGPFHE